MSFDKALGFTLDQEGGFASRAADRGGPTNRGITQPAYDAWRTRHQFGTRPVEFASDDEIRAIYFEDYWTPCRCEEMPPVVGALMFDMAVNSGQWNATIALQEALNVKQDGKIGQVTLLAANNASDPTLAFLKARAGVYRDSVATHPADVANLHGWICRLLDFQDQAAKGAFA